MMEKKKNTLYCAVLLTWLLCLTGFVPFLVSHCLSLESIPQRLASLFVLLCLAFFWLYGIHFWAFFLFTIREKRRAAPHPAAAQTQSEAMPSVALLYATADDFDWGAAHSCVRQSYPKFHVFVLDASSTDRYRNQVDAFHREFPDVVTVVRRTTREGFKAASINHALNTVASNYEYFAICDSDNYLPVDFLTRMSGYLQQEPQLGFVQASHKSNGLIADAFCSDLQILADTRWDYHNVPRNRYGLTFCLGHGVLMRTEAWSEAGGFPPIVSEDIALTMLMLAEGYRGRFVPEVVCREGIPPNLKAWRKSHFRMVAADLECLFKTVLPFLRKTAPSWVEKVDALARSIQIPLVSSILPFLLCLIYFSGGFLHCFSNAEVAWAFLAFMYILAFGGYARFFAQCYGKPFALGRFLAKFTSIQLSLSFVSTAALVAYTLTGRAHFFVTAAEAGSDRPDKTQHTFSSLAGLDPNGSMILVLEATLSLALLYFALKTANMMILAVSLSSLLTLLMICLNRDSLPLRALMYIPPVLFWLGPLISMPNIAPDQVFLLAALSVLIYS